VRRCEGSPSPDGPHARLRPPTPPSIEPSASLTWPSPSTAAHQRLHLRRHKTRCLSRGRPTESARHLWSKQARRRTGKNFLQIGAPTWARTLADVTAQMVPRWLRATPPARATMSGTYHATPAGHTSWCGFVTAIFERAEAMGLGRSPVVEPIPTSSYPTQARRPMN